jgi:hypothetical protein
MLTNPKYKIRDTLIEKNQSSLAPKSFVVGLIGEAGDGTFIYAAKPNCGDDYVWHNEDDFNLVVPKKYFYQWIDYSGEVLSYLMDEFGTTVGGTKHSVINHTRFGAGIALPFREKKAAATKRKDSFEDEDD